MDGGREFGATNVEGYFVREGDLVFGGDFDFVVEVFSLDVYFFVSELDVFEDGVDVVD
jgi:hypothetical protein